MALDIYFSDDIARTVRALDRANRRALYVAQLYGLDRETAWLYHIVYHGALSDLAAAFGLTLEKPTRAAWEMPATIEGQWCENGRET